MQISCLKSQKFGKKSTKIFSKRNIRLCGMKLGGKLEDSSTAVLRYERKRMGSVSSQKPAQKTCSYFLSQVGGGQRLALVAKKKKKLLKAGIESRKQQMAAERKKRDIKIEAEQLNFNEELELEGMRQTAELEMKIKKMQITQELKCSQRERVEQNKAVFPKQIDIELEISSVKPGFEPLKMELSKLKTLSYNQNPVFRPRQVLTC